MARNYRLRLAGNNFAEGSGVTLTASSAMTNFDADNILHSRRSKVTRTNGHFEVTSSNKVIYYNDGSDGSVSLTEASYTSPSSLASHIQTTLNATSSNWTCTYSTSTNKFTIDRSSGTKTLRKSQTTNAAWTMLGYVTGSDENAGEADAARNHTTERYTLDLGTAQAVTFFALIGPKSADFTMSTTQATATLYANSADSWASPALTKSCTVTSDGIFLFLDDEDDTSYRYWRFEFEDKTNTVGSQGFKFGHLYLGDYTTVTQTNIQPGFGFREIDPSVELESEGGSLFYDERVKYREFEALTIDQLTQTERLDIETLYARVGKTKPFYFSADPLQNLTSSFAEWGAYVRFSAEPRFSNIIRDRFVVDLALREAV